MPSRATRNALIAAASNLSTAYNLVVINIVHVIVQNQYCGGAKCKGAVNLASTAVLVGAIIGQLTFGYIGDCLGRSAALQLTMALSILGAGVSAFAVPLSPDNPSSIFYFLALTRFVLGVGVGGVYPLSATIAAESASSAAERGRTASLVFSMQGIANLAVPSLALLLVQLPGGNPEHTSDLGLSWRLMLGLGALPGVLLAPFKASETRKSPPRVATVAAEGRGVSEGEQQVGSVRPLSAAPNEPLAGSGTLIPQPAQAITLLQALRMRMYWGKLIGTAGGWLLFDITFYGNSLFQAPVLEAIFNATKEEGFAPIEGGIQHNLALQMVFCAAIGLPGYYVAVCLMDRLGRRNIQLQGFIMMGITYGALGIWLHDLQGLAPPAGTMLLLLLYGCTFFFSNFGPNSTTFILPAETFPAHLRSTLNGFSAAMGKAGATIGSSAFQPLKDQIGLPGTMLACSGVSLLGALITYLFVEDRRGKSMEGDAGGARLVENDFATERPMLSDGGARPSTPPFDPLWPQAGAQQRKPPAR